MKIPLSKIVFGSFFTSWCVCAYPNHPDGCGNYLKKKWCPPFAHLFPCRLSTRNYEYTLYDEGLDILKLREGEEPTMWLFYTEFDLGEWARNLQKEHPWLSDRQVRIPYLWQDKVYSTLYSEANLYQWTVSKPCQLLKRPEANGVNLFSTSRINGGPVLEKNPQEKVYMMAILGEM